VRSEVESRTDVTVRAQADNGAAETACDPHMIIGIYCETVRHAIESGDPPRISLPGPVRSQ